MENKYMENKLMFGIAINLSELKRTEEGFYILEKFQPGVDYCDAKEEKWIWSIGRHKKTGQVLASTNIDFYNNSDYECIWLR